MSEIHQAVNGLVNQYRGILWGVVVLLVLGGWGYTARSIEKLDEKIGRVLLRMDDRMIDLELKSASTEVFCNELARRLDKLDR